LLETENIKLDVLNINKVNDVYKHFFECLITDKNSNTKSERISEPIDYSFKWVSQEMEKAALNYLVLLEKSDKGKMEMNLNLDFHFNFNFIPAVKMTANLPFLEEAMKVIFNNAMQHTRLYAIKKRCNPQIIISINISEHPTDLNRGFLEITFINRSEPIDQDRLDQVNNPKPRRLTKDLRKESSTGIGLFISRIQLKRTSGEGANIILKNLKEDLVEVKLVLPVTMQKTYEGIANIQNKKVTKPNLVQNYKILYVEDEPKKRESSMKVLKKLLKANSTFVCSTDNYTDASTIVQEQDLILVLMDFNILSKRGGNTADSKPGIKLINKIRTKNPDLPIVILSAASFSDIQQGLEEAKIDVSNLIEWHLSNRNSLIEPGKIYKTLFKDLADPGSKFLLQSVLHYFNENAQTSAENQSVSSFIEKEYRYTLATLDKFSTAFNAYRNRCIRKEEIDELLIFQSKASSIEELLTCIKNWISIEDQQSIHIDDLEDNSKEKIFRNEYVRSIIQVIIVDNSLFKNVPVSLRYWAQTLNIFITTTQDPARTLVQHWPEIPFGLRGALSKLRHGVSNKITGKDLSTLLEYIQITEKLLLIMGSLKSFSEFENIVKRSIEEAKKLIKEEPVRKNEEIVSKLNALSDELKKNYNLEEVGEFVKTIEDLKLLLGI
jgi:CheY-like chemotaxis protein